MIAAKRPVIGSAIGLLLAILIVSKNNTFLFLSISLQPAFGGTLCCQNCGSEAVVQISSLWHNMEVHISTTTDGGTNRRLSETSWARLAKRRVKG
ncbi:hypothetical protein LY78DRAFT_661525 [Colletotrichum sublineola]|nr:hypothetical protein LY78DRAFT_661525 [Colletotrichum sublineola]